MENQLLEKYIKGETSPEENSRIGHWLNEDSRHIKELTALRRCYEATIWQEQSSLQNVSPKPQRWSVRYAYPLLKVAAVAILLLAISNLLLIKDEWTSTQEELQTLYVPAGQRAQVTLADGTTVWLNAMSTLVFPTSFNKEKRHVELIGEGFFEVTTDKERPFIVQTQKHNIKVLGTTFNVNAYQHTHFFATSLLEGKVEVTNRDNKVEAVLEPGTMVSARMNSSLKKSAINNYDYFRWKEGLICFNEISVEKLFKKLELYYDIKIINKNRAIKRHTFSGKLRVCDGINHALEVIKTHTPFHYYRDNDKNIITIK